MVRPEKRQTAQLFTDGQYLQWERHRYKSCGRQVVPSWTAVMTIAYKRHIIFFPNLVDNPSSYDSPDCYDSLSCYDS